MEEKFIFYLKREFRLQYINPIEIINKDNNNFHYFKTKKFLFYGYSIGNLGYTHDSDI